MFLMLLLLETRVSLRLNRAGMGKGFYLENSCREIMNDLKFSYSGLCDVKCVFPG